MKKMILAGLFGLALTATVSSCGNGKTDALQSQLDSLSMSDSLHQEDIRQIGYEGFYRLLSLLCA